MGNVSGDKLGFKKHTIFIIAIAGCGLAILHMIVNRIGYQTNAVRNFIPVKAKVLEKTFKKWAASDYSGTFYEFKVTYEYEVNGRRFTCDKVGPLGGGFGLKRSAKFYLAYRKDQLVKAYYNPENPNQAFLIPHIESRLYVFLLVLVAFLCLIIIGYFEAENYARNKGKFYHNDEEENYWHPKVSIPMNFWKYCVVFTLWHVAGALSLWHYCSVATKPLQSSGIIGMIVYEAVGLAWFILVFRYKRSAHVQQVPN